MKQDIILAGVGGQGILSIATVLGEAALTGGLHIKQAEVHGMSQRGGDVQSNLRISSEPIHSDLIPFGQVDMIMSLEPMEALRYVQELSEDGWIVTSSIPFVNINNYPDKEDVYKHLNALPHVVMLDVEELAKEAGAPAQASSQGLRPQGRGSRGQEHCRPRSRLQTQHFQTIINNNLTHTLLEGPYPKPGHGPFSYYL